MNQTFLPRAVSVVVNVTEDGRIIIPAQALAELGVRQDDRLSATFANGEVVIDTFDAALRRLQAQVRQRVPEGVSLVDELIAGAAPKLRVTEFALDSSAVLALVNLEPGAEFVRSIRERSCISTVNLAEVATKFSDWGVDFDDLTKLLVEGKIEIVAFTDTQAHLAGELRAATRSRGLSLGDRACLALAIERGLTAVTADAAWSGATAASVHLIRS